MKSWKIGAIAGLIAGIFVLGILSDFFKQIAVSSGLYGDWYKPICIDNVIINIPLYAFWGIVFGIIYSKAYDVIPKSNISKGIIYGIFLWLIITIRIQTFNIAYGRVLQVVSDIPIGFLEFLLFGLVLGILYDELLYCELYPLKEKSKIKTYEMKGGILPGAIAGFCGGMAASITAVIGPVLGLWGFFEGPIRLAFDLWVGQLGTHILINMIWGAIFGAFFTKVYDLVPGKKIKKGLYYGLIVFLITSFYIGAYCACWSIYHNDWPLAIAFIGNCHAIGFANTFFFGLVLGLLYRKPRK